MALTNAGLTKAMRTGVVSGDMYLALHEADNSELSGGGYARKQLVIDPDGFGSDGTYSFRNVDVYDGQAGAEDADKVSIFASASGNDPLFTPDPITVDVGAPGLGVTVRGTVITLAFVNAPLVTTAGRVKAMRSGLFTGDVRLSLHLDNDVELRGHGYAARQLDLATAQFRTDGSVSFASVEVYTATSASAQEATRFGLQDGRGNQLLNPRPLVFTDASKRRPGLGQTVVGTFQFR